MDKVSRLLVMSVLPHGTDSSVEETPLDRELQSKELGRIMGEAYPQPFIFLGYVVTTPHAPRRE